MFIYSYLFISLGAKNGPVGWNGLKFLNFLQHCCNYSSGWQPCSAAATEVPGVPHTGGSTLWDPSKTDTRRSRFETPRSLFSSSSSRVPLCKEFSPQPSLVKSYEAILVILIKKSQRVPCASVCPAIICCIKLFRYLTTTEQKIMPTMDSSITIQR